MIAIASFASAAAPLTMKEGVLAAKQGQRVKLKLPYPLTLKIKIATKFP
jgi:hypothetical protein